MQPNLFEICTKNLYFTHLETINLLCTLCSRCACVRIQIAKSIILFSCRYKFTPDTRCAHELAIYDRIWQRKFNYFTISIDFPLAFGYEPTPFIVLRSQSQIRILQYHGINIGAVTMWQRTHTEYNFVNKHEVKAPGTADAIINYVLHFDWMCLVLSGRLSQRSMASGREEGYKYSSMHERTEGNEFSKNGKCQILSMFTLVAVSWQWVFKRTIAHCMWTRIRLLAR